MQQQLSTFLYETASGLQSVSYAPDGQAIPRANRVGAPFHLQFTLAIPGAITANDPIFAMRNRASGGNGRTGFIKRIKATYDYLSVAGADKGLGFYFQRFDTAVFTGGVAITALDPQTATTDFTDIRFVAAGTALTIGAASYIAGVFAPSHISYALARSDPYTKTWEPEAPNGLPVSPGQGIVLRAGGAAALVGLASSICIVTFEIDWLEGAAS